MSTSTRIDPDDARAVVAAPRWRAKVSAQADGCYVWVGALSKAGYGQIKLDGRIAYAHRVALVAEIGRDLAPGMVVDHLCRVRACVNPDHLREVTSRENSLAPGSDSIAAVRAAQTHCVRGHPLAGDNLVPSVTARGRRGCRACARDYRSRIKGNLTEEIHA